MGDLALDRMQVNVEKYHEWIQLVAELTVSSLNSWQWASNSVFYLLGLWSRLVSSMPYLKGESPSLLETYVPKITEAYLTSRSVLSAVYLTPLCIRANA
jgi:exportin-7